MGAWIDDAGAFWARLVNTPHGTFGKPKAPAQEAVLWVLRARVGVAVAEIRAEDWDATRFSKGVNWLECGSLEDVAMYFGWLKQTGAQAQGGILDEFNRGRLAAAFARLVEWASDLPYDAETCPWLARAA